MVKTDEKELETKEGFKNTKIGWIPEDWSVLEFGLFVDKSKLKSTTDLNSFGYKCIELEHINQLDGTINGYVDSENKKSSKNKFKKGEVLFGKLRPYLRKYWLAEFDGICSSEIWVLNGKSNICDNHFLFYFIQQHKFIQVANVTSGTKMPRADWGFISNYPFVIPTHSEQQKIALILSTWDTSIENIQTLIEKLQLRKKGLIQDLLTGKTRLTGFNVEWKESKLGNYFTERKEMGYDNLELLSVGRNGVYPQDTTEKKDTSNSNKSKYKRICVGDIGYNTMRMWQGRSALSSLEGIVSPAYTILKPKEHADSVFFSYLFKLEAMIHKFYRNSQGMVSDTWMCKFKDLAIIKFNAPSCKDEQTAIANILKNADQEIELQKKYLEQLQTQKKGLMQQLLTGKIRVEV